MRAAGRGCPSASTTRPVATTPDASVRSATVATSRARHEAAAKVGARSGASTTSAYPSPGRMPRSVHRPSASVVDSRSDQRRREVDAQVPGQGALRARAHAGARDRRPVRTEHAARDRRAVGDAPVGGAVRPRDRRRRRARRGGGTRGGTPRPALEAGGGGRQGRGRRPGARRIRARGGPACAPRRVPAAREEQRGGERGRQLGRRSHRDSFRHAGDRRRRGRGHERHQQRRPRLSTAALSFVEPIAQASQRPLRPRAHRLHGEPEARRDRAGRQVVEVAQAQDLRRLLGERGHRLEHPAAALEVLADLHRGGARRLGGEPALVSRTAGPLPMAVAGETARDAGEPRARRVARARWPRERDEDRVLCEVVGVRLSVHKHAREAPDAFELGESDGGGRKRGHASLTMAQEPGTGSPLGRCRAREPLRRRGRATRPRNTRTSARCRIFSTRARPVTRARARIVLATRRLRARRSRRGRPHQAARCGGSRGVRLDSKPPRAKNAYTAMVVASQQLERTRIVQGLAASTSRAWSARRIPTRRSRSPWTIAWRSWSCPSRGSRDPMRSSSSPSSATVSTCAPCCWCRRACVRSHGPF